MEHYFVMIETSGLVCSAAIATFNGQVNWLDSYEPNAHSNYLTVFLEKLLKKIPNKKDQILAISVSEGPGSFTGLRIGVSAAKGLAYGLNKPLIAIDTLLIMAIEIKNKYPESIDNYTLLIPMLDARRNEVYTKIFNHNLEPLTNTYSIKLSDTSFKHYLDRYKIIFFGDGAKKAQNIIKHPNAKFIPEIYPHAKNMFLPTKEKFLKKDFVDIAYFEPFYLKPFIPTTKPKDLLKNATRS